MIKKLLPGVPVFFITLVIGAFAVLSPVECRIGHGRMIDGGNPWFFTVCRRGPNWLVHSIETYPNAAKANAVFEDRLRKAVRVRQLDHKRLADGQTLAKRAVADFRDTQTEEQFTSIFWIDDRSVNSITSTSRYYALLAEWWDK